MRYDILKNQAESLPDTIEIKLDRRAAVLLFDEKPEFWDFLQWLFFRDACNAAYQNEINRRLAYQAAALPQVSTDQPRPALRVVSPDTITVKLDSEAASQLFSNKPECWTYSQHERYRTAYTVAFTHQINEMWRQQAKEMQREKAEQARPAARFKRFYHSALAA